MSLERQIEQRQLLWLLISRHGGREDVTWTELREVPHLPPLTLQTTETGFTISTGRTAGEAS